MDFKVQHPKPHVSTGGVPREKSFRECFAPLPSQAQPSKCLLLGHLKAITDSESS